MKKAKPYPSPGPLKTITLNKNGKNRKECIIKRLPFTIKIY